MNNSHFKKPLIQSAFIVALFLLFFIFIFSAQPTGFFAGIGAILTGLLKTIAYIVGLTFGLLISILILIGIFIGAIALVSRQQAKQLYEQLAAKFSFYINEARSLCTCNQQQDNTLNELTEKINTLTSALSSKESQYYALENNINKKQEQLDIASENLKKVLQEKDAIHDNYVFLSEELASSKESLTQLESDFIALQDKFSKLEEEKNILLKSIEEKDNIIASLSREENDEEETGVFNYFSTPEQKSLFKASVADAVEKELTYAQIDEYLTEKLDKETDKIVKEHPRLTKDFIRTIRS